MNADAPLLERTLLLLKKAQENGVTYLEIYQETQLRPNWLSGIATGKIADPSVRRVQALHDYLAKQAQ